MLDLSGGWKKVDEGNDLRRGGGNAINSAFPLANFAEHDFASHVENFCRKFVASQVEIKT
jgi:hypothetical protein